MSAQPLPPGVEPVVATRVAELLEKLHASRPDDDLTGVARAFEFAESLHHGQLRANGEPYVSHPLEVAHILADMRMDPVSVEAGLLHDVAEDTSATIDDLRAKFGDDVARCVEGVTKLGRLAFDSAEDRQAENYRKMLLAMVNDIRVIIVKLADRLHNMRTLGALSPERQERIARETMEIYAPIAHRLGMGRIRGELEDLSFRFMDPPGYDEVMSAINDRRLSNLETLEEIRRKIETELRREGIPSRVEARVKRPFSIYQKLKRQKISVHEVYDLLALRIVTDSVKHCYAALGVIHNEWRPVPGRIKDFIAIPRPNLYQSLHTSVIGPNGQPFEVQIRTEEMHRIAEEGIAAHWKYKEGKRGPELDDQRVAWLRHLVEWQRDMKDSSEFSSTLKLDLYPEEVYTFTPKGRVIVLPKDATPVDFAYAIHSDVGTTCSGAKVNGRMVSLRQPLLNGDIVEIITQQGHRPSRDWLSYVKTSRARNKIRHIINEAERDKAIEIGNKYLVKEAQRLGVPLGKITRAELERVAGEYGFSKIEDLYAQLGYGKFSARSVLQKVAPDLIDDAVEKPAAPPAPEPEHARRGLRDADNTIVVTGADDIMVYRAKCCSAIRGEAIVGYVTRGKGVAVHARTCPNVTSLLYESERRIDVQWARLAADPFAVRLVLQTDDRPGLLNQLTSVLTHDNTNIRSLEARGENDKGDGAVVEMTVDVKDLKQMEKLMGSMRRIPGVRDVERVASQ